MGRDGDGYSPICISVKQKYFCKRGLTRLPINRSDLPVGWICCLARRFHRPCRTAAGAMRKARAVKRSRDMPLRRFSMHPLTRRQYDDHQARSDLPRIAEAGHGSAARKFRLYLAAQPGLLETRRAGSDRRKTWVPDVQPGRPHGDNAQQGRRVSPLRMECLLVARRRSPDTLLSSDATSSFPHAVLEFISDTADPTMRRFMRLPSPSEIFKDRLLAAPYGSSGRKAFTSALSAAVRMAPMGRPASSSWTARH
jgi:hypothetical protein